VSLKLLKLHSENVLPFIVHACMCLRAYIFRLYLDIIAYVVLTWWSKLLHLAKRLVGNEVISHSW